MDRKKDSDYSRFKKLLEYFVSHLEWIVNNDTTHLGYDEYIKPIKDFKIAGQGWKGAKIQNQIKNWDMYDDEQVCINIYAPNIMSGGTYLNWKDSWNNIRPFWRDNHVFKLYLSKDENAQAKAEYSIALTELGLFDNAEPNDNLKDFFIRFKLLLYTDMNNNSTLNRFQNLITQITTSHNVILTGAPGTGKSYLAKQLAMWMTIGKFVKETDADSQNFDNQYMFVQFHPSYDYTDFVEGLRPIKSNDANTIGFQLKDGQFKVFCERAKKDPGHNYVFVIDEINRGEISKIFGELFFSIDPGYRGIKGAVFTQYSNLHEKPEEKFYVPENVYIIGTMNDIDRSVESFDFAMRRRFTWIEITAEESAENMKLSDEGRKRLRCLNEQIEKTDGLNASYHIGGAYFLDQNGNEVSNIEKVWKYRIEPLLNEYLRGFPDSDNKKSELRKAYFDENNG